MTRNKTNDPSLPEGNFILKRITVLFERKCHDQGDCDRDRYGSDEDSATNRPGGPRRHRSEDRYIQGSVLGRAVTDPLLLDRASAGRFLVDTGDTWRNSVPGYLPGWNPFYKQVNIKVAPHEEVGSRLIAMGIDPAVDIGTVILTHFHHDHTGGLDHFPRSRIIGPRANYAISIGLRGMMTGCLPQRWPIWLRPELVDIDGPAVGPFSASRAITKDRRILLVPTPGHVDGHVSVVVRNDDITYFLAGDATYSQANLLAGKTDGVTNDPATALATLQAIRSFAAQEPTILLPSHDPEGPVRLATGSVLA